MTAPDSRDSVERVVAEMRERLVDWDNDCDELAKADDLAKWMDRLAALPQQAGGEVAELFDWLRWLAGDKREVKALEQHYAALQAEVARLRESLNERQSALEAVTLIGADAEAALREAGRDAERWRFLTSMDVGEYIGLVEYNNPDELAHAIDAARLVRDGDSGEGES